MRIGILSSSRGRSPSQGVSQSAIQDSGEFLYADYIYSGATENNRPPWVLSVVASDHTIIGQTITITCIWDKQSGSSVGTPTLGVYKQDYRNTIAGTLNRTLITTKTDGINSYQGTIVTTVYTYMIQESDIGKFLSFDFIGKVSGAGNNDSVILSSNLLDSVTADLPEIYDEVQPEELLLVDGYNEDDDLWPNVGTDGGSWTATGTGHVKESGGEVSFNGSGGLTKSITASANANWNAWCKFTWSDDSEIKTVFELSNNRQLEVMTTGQLRLRSTTNQTTSGSIPIDTECNLICEHLASGNFYVRVEENNGTLILEETLTGTGTLGLSAGTATLCEDLESTNRLVGSLWEFGVKHGTTTTPQKTDILTRLKSL